jgi:large subunit ribosomal protein L23
MSLFSKKNTKEESIKETVLSRDVPKKDLQKSVASNSPKKKSVRDFSNVLVRPRITEKATESAEKNVYVFEVSVNSNKKEIHDAVIDKYGVTPVKVNITKIPAKKVFSRGKKGVKSGGKKAIVYLKKGDNIEIV